MSTNNKVFQVLVTKGNQAVLATGKQLDELADGQLGIFNADTNVSIDSTVTTLPRAVYIALGVGTDNMRFSAGQEIQIAHLTGYSYNAYSAGVNQKFELSDFDAKCDTDYAIKVEFRNSQIYGRQGYVPLSETYAIRTACCDGCEPCPSGSKGEVAGKLFKEVFNNALGYLVPSLTYDFMDGGAGNDESNPVTITTVAEVDAFMEDPASKDAIVKLGFEVMPVAVNQNSNIQMGYNNARATVAVPSLVDGFNCTGKFTTTVQAKAEEGKGVDIKQREYFAGGWNGRPGIYRASVATGLEAAGFDYQTDPSANYNQYHVVYDQFSVAGWGEYLNNLQTIIAIPVAGTTTVTSLKAVLDKLYAGKSTILVDPA